MNSLYQQLAQSKMTAPQQQPLQSLNQKSLLRNNNNLFQKFLNSNPKDLINNLISNNPQLKNIMSMFNSSGMTPKQFFYQYAQQNGIDPDQFLESLKGMERN